MKIISVFSPKGGSGKSSLALNLTAAFISRGYTAALLCHDPQASPLVVRELALKRHSEGKGDPLPFPVFNGGPEFAAARGRGETHFDVLIVDHMPNLTADNLPSKKHTDLVLVPIRPEMFDLASWRQAKEVLDPYEKLEIVSLFERNKNSQVAVRQKLPASWPEIGYRTAVPNTFGEGKTLYSPGVLKSGAYRQAKAEVDLVLEATLSRLGMPPFKDDPVPASATLVSTTEGEGA